MTEDEALTQFWWHVTQERRHDFRLAWLRELERTFVDNVLAYLDRKHAFQSVRHRRRRYGWLKRATCFCCSKAQAAHTHHVVPMQNGGSNSRRNLVGLCKKCHEDVHPWMKGKPRIDVVFPEQISPLPCWSR
jgi:5-methylcytosine-specific restriction endonuclease McrA